MSEFKKLEDLIVWQKARDIRKIVYDVTTTFPQDEKRRLSDQMIRSSRSISDNIAEGFGRYHHQENIQFCRIARGSAFELINQIKTSSECKYINNAQENKLISQAEKCIKILNGYIRYLFKAKKDHKTKEPKTEYDIKEYKKS